MMQPQLRRAPLGPARPTSHERDQYVVDELRRLGASEDEIALAFAEGSVGIAADLLFRSRARLSARQLADASGRSVDEVIEIYRRLGVRIDDPDAVTFRETEDHLIRLFTAAAQDLFDPSERNDILYVIASALHRISDAVVNEYVGAVEPRILDGDDGLRRHLASTAMAAELAEELARMLGPLLIHHIRQATLRQRRAMPAAPDRLLSRYTIGFIDLVGSTQLTRRFTATDLTAFVRRFETMAFEIAHQHRGSIIKHIGDEIMFAALDPNDGCRLAVELMRALRSGDVSVRGGLAFGDVLSRRGDFYGPVVNLASRLADQAVNDEVLIDAAANQAADPAIVREPAGRRMLKGFDTPVPVWSLPT
ncbi:MAG: hypothetical protein GC206_13790 [Alphaproteobacteria bacterium]|nr:hypothetical protein [Alphaproteobacteria bacterium]